MFDKAKVKQESLSKREASTEKVKIILPTEKS